MQITINISKEMYDWINDPNKFYNSYGVSDFCELIKKGTPLPKGHGRLKDVDELLKKHPEFDTYPFPSTTIENAPTIIEADKEQS